MFIGETKFTMEKRTKQHKKDIQFGRTTRGGIRTPDRLGKYDMLGKREDNIFKKVIRTAI